MREIKNNWSLFGSTFALNDVGQEVEAVRRFIEFVDIDSDEPLAFEEASTKWLAIIKEIQEESK